jgi:hypothetical protein
MQGGSLAALLVLVGLAGCPGGNGAVGQTCHGSDDCGGTLQCVSNQCVPGCERAPDCGDGYSCDDHHQCQLAVGQRGDNCSSEVDCGPGLSCRIDGAEVDDTTHLLQATCSEATPARLEGDACTQDADCRNWTCALGRCVNLCRQTRDCATGNTCVDIPRVEASGAEFAGCLPAKGTLSWSIPVTAPSAEVLLPVPSVARSVELIMSIDDPSQLVGAQSVLSPAGARLYSVPCSPLSPTDPCPDDDAEDQYFGNDPANPDAGNKLRHLPAVGQSVLLMPDSQSAPVQHGEYIVRVSSFRANGSEGSAIPRVTAVVQLDSGAALDLHFFFLDLTEHPCVDPTGGPLNAAAAAAGVFQDEYLAALRQIFVPVGITIGTVTYEDISNRPELDGLDVANASALLSLGKYATGINVFFVRSLSPLGVQAYGPNPGPAGLGSTPQSGIAISVDTLCYRRWASVGRLTGYEIARYMGLYHNVELETAEHPTWRDPIPDSGDTADNLMYFSSAGGTDLSAGQAALLMQSAVLR